MTTRRSFLQHLSAGAALAGSGVGTICTALADVVSVEAPVRAVTSGPKAHFFG